MKKLRFVFGDQLSLSVSSLRDLNKRKDVVLLCEVKEEATHVKHHQQKIVLILASMRHFAEELKAQGVQVHYVTLDDPKNTGTLDRELKRAVQQVNPDEVIITAPSEYRVLAKIKTWQQEFAIPLTLRPDDRYLCNHEEFSNWAKNKKSLTMEFFYRQMRARYNILMTKAGKPMGGKWNYDKENRKPIKGKISVPEHLHFAPDAITQAVIKTVQKHFADHFGTVTQFGWAVTRKQARAAMQHFIKKLLPHFGDFQDAMQMGEPFLFHSLLSPYLNIGLLQPLEVCQAIEQAYLEGSVPLNAAEGFIRQILGWREFVRGVYWLKMPDYAQANFFNAQRKLPWFYWDGQTPMQCIKACVAQTRDYAYAHHIQRLMVTGNFALLAGINPQEVCEWYLVVYADAFDWVELPNTLGMSLYGDGGVLASKPYAASGKYINRMSNYCVGCKYNPNETIGENACPFNALYWNFLATNQDKLQHNRRLNFTYATWNKQSAAKKASILAQAQKLLSQL